MLTLIVGTDEDADALNDRDSDEGPIVTKDEPMSTSRGKDHKAKPGTFEMYKDS